MIHPLIKKREIQVPNFYYVQVRLAGCVCEKSRIRLFTTNVCRCILCHISLFSRLNIIKKTGGIIHIIAHCQKCEWKDESYITAEKEAERHVKETGHNVVVETGHYWEYKK